MLPVIGGPEDEVLKINVCMSSGTRHSHSQNDRSRTWHCTAFNLFTGVGTRHCHSRNKIGAVQTQSPVLYGYRNALLPFTKHLRIASTKSSPQARFFQILSLEIRPETSLASIARRRRENFEYSSFEIRPKATILKA